MRVARLSAAEAADEIWREVERNGTVIAPASPTPAPTNLAIAPMPVRTPLERPMPHHTVASLQNLDGPAFIEAAFATILGRAANEAEFAQLTADLAGGTPKIDLLGQLQASPEGRATGRRLEGLGTRFLARRLYRLPVVGPGMQWAAAVLRQTGVSRAVLGRIPATTALKVELRTAITENHDLLITQIEALSAQVLALQDQLHQRETSVRERFAQLQATFQAQLHQQQISLDTTARRLPAMQAALDTVARHVPPLQDASQIAQAAHAKLSRHGEATAERVAGLEEHLASTVPALGEQEARLDHQGSRQAALEQRIEAVIAELCSTAGTGGEDHPLRLEWNDRVLRAERLAAETHAEAVAQQREIGLIREAVRQSGAAPALPPDHALDPLYVAFEDRFRGTRADIKQRQRVYLPVLAESAAGRADRPILDVGCGRGEFLDLLRDEGLAAAGVDSNEAMAATCRAAGLDVAAADALAHLAALPAGSLGAVTGFHIIEHLHFATLVRLLDEALRALAPGGVVIFETPNPANLLTASRWFWLDPTHHHPLPGEMVAMVAEARGYTRISILALHPAAGRFEAADPALGAQLDALFYGPQDYALLARKP